MGLVAIMIAAVVGLAVGLVIALGAAFNAKAKDPERSFFASFIVKAFIAVPLVTIATFFGIFYWAKSGFKTSSSSSSCELSSGFGGPYEVSHRDGTQKVATDFKACTGNAVGYYVNGQKAFDRYYHRGIFQESLFNPREYDERTPIERDFPWREWYFNGQIKAERIFTNNYGSYGPNQYVTQWYENGQKQSEGEVSRLVRNDGSIRYGIHRAWYRDGQLACEIEYPQGQSSKGSEAPKSYWKINYWSEDGQPLGDKIPEPLSYGISIFYSSKGEVEYKKEEWRSSDCNLLETQHILPRQAVQLENW